MDVRASGRVATGTGGRVWIGMTGRVSIGIGGGIHWNMQSGALCFKGSHFRRMVGIESLVKGTAG
jgi:hypothetical protein